jgi:glycosyltransferase involved in cell wall biosynthesis
MKILYISSPSFADCDMPLVRALQEKGHDVTFLLMLAPHNLQYTIIDIKELYPKTGVFPAAVYPELKLFEDYLEKVNFFVANRTSDKSYSFSYFRKSLSIFNFIRKGSFDVVHTSCLFGWKRFFLYFAGKIVTTIHDPFPHSGEKKKSSNVNRILAIKLNRGIVLLNNKQIEKFCAFYKVDYGKVCVNRLGVYENIALMASNVKVDKGNNNVLFFGRISPYKGIEYLCKAMERVREEVSDATLTIAGGGKIYFDISPYLDQGFVDLQNRFIRVEEVAKMLKQSKVCVCPYTDATQSGVIMTSFALSRPVIASNVGGLGEMIDDGKSGLLVEPKNPENLAKAIIKLLKNPDMLQEMEDYIHDTYYNGKESWNSIAETYLSFYKKIL